MARLPTRDDLGPRPIPRSRGGVPQLNTRDMLAPARALESVGKTAKALGDDIQDREATAEAKEADALVAEKIRDALYNPETGFANMQGRNAVDQYQSIQDRLEAIRAEATEGMTTLGAKKVEDAVRARMERALGTVDRHTSAQRLVWLRGASEARIEQAVQDAAFDNNVDEAIKVLRGEMMGAAAREGWSQDEFNVKFEERRSEVMATQIKTMANDNPEAALEYLNENEGRMRPDDVYTLRNVLEPLAEEQRGARIGREAALGVPVLDDRHGTQIDYELTGKARPNPPAPKLQNLLGTAAAQVFGKGARVVIFSGQENSGHQHGSNRHKTGLAADVRVYDASGNQIALSDSRAKDFMLAAARLGARGIGAGSEYMGNAFHIDMVPHEDYGTGQAPTWGSTGKAMGSDLIAAMSEGTQVSMSDLLKLPPGRERDAALREYSLFTEASSAEQTAALKAAGNRAFERIVAGESLSDMSIDELQALGRQEYSALLTLERSIANGVPVETDPEVYLGLRALATEDPAAFKRINLIEYADRLSEADLKKMIDAQTKDPDSVTGIAPSTLMTTAKRSLEAAGFDSTPKPGSDDAKAMAGFQSRIVRWEDAFRAEHGRKPTPAEIDEQIGIELIPVVINPGGIWNQEEALVFQLNDVDLDPDKLVDSAITVGDLDIPAAVVREQMLALEESGQEVTAENLARRIITLMDEANVR